MRGSIFSLAVAAVFCLTVHPSAARAADRCTKSQMALADRQLWLNRRDQASATSQVLPWAAPVEDPQNPERRLVQRDYVIGYDDDLRGPVWAANVLGLHRLRGGRIDCFRKDPRLPDAVASGPRDYDEAIFDQGHMVPNADMAFHDIPIMNTFMMSNMSPQFCQFNRGIWQILETLVRGWGQTGGNLYILNGAIFDRDGDGRRDADDASARMRSRSGAERVSVPSAYFKILARDLGDGRLETLTLRLPHDQTDVDGPAALDYLTASITTIAVVERETGLRFFNALSPDQRVERDQLWDVADIGFRSLVAAACRRTAGASLAPSDNVFILP